MPGSILLGFLNGYSPPWAADLIPRVAEAFTWPVRRADLNLSLADCYATDRNQYHATQLLSRLLAHLPDPGSKIVGLTSVDLFIPVLTFVFGQSQLDGPAAIVSTHRLHAEFYGLPADRSLLFARTVKEVVHELGHAFGLVHCPDYRCVMSASMSVDEVDLKEERLCAACREAVECGKR